MTPQELLKYELPDYAEYISIGFLQSILAWYYAKKVNRKYARFLLRKKREELFSQLTS